MSYDPADFTYGAELELADIDRTRELPEGCGWDVRDFSMVNSNGIAVDPKGKLWHQGGEINTRPTSTIAGQVGHFIDLLQLFPEAKVNYRSNLHVHVRAPQLKHDLAGLKRLQLFVHENLPEMLLNLEPIPKPTAAEYPSAEELAGALWRYKRRRRSHQTFLSNKRLTKQLSATTVDQFMRYEVPETDDGKPMWHAQPRCCVNIRQLLQTDTIEFRHFPGTLNPQEFQAALVWCRAFMDAALNGRTPRFDHIYAMTCGALPRFEPYVHQLETRYRATCADGTVPPAERKDNIAKILRGEL